jgi:GTP-binding protein
VTVLNKVDALSPEDIAERRAALEAASGGEVMTMSGVARTGVIEVLRVLRARIDRGRVAARDAMEEPQAWRP